MANDVLYRVRFKCPDGIHFEFDWPSVWPISEVRSKCSLFRDLVLPSIFKPCSFDVRVILSDRDIVAEAFPDFFIVAFQALCRALRYPYLFNSKFYRYALKNKEKRSSQA